MHHQVPELRYEVAISIEKANVVQLHGRFSAGVLYLTIFRAGLRALLVRAEDFAIADDGYGDARCCRPPANSISYHQRFAQLRARHENMNQRLKIFSVLPPTFATV